MPKSYLIAIDETPGQDFAQFNPRTLTVAAGDVINWRNNTSRSHKLVLRANPSVVWVSEIPGKLEGQPAPTSQKGVTFGAATTSTGVDYMCATHTQEIGTIIVTSS
jgi:plastocyanin